METKMIRKPFEVELAKKITNGEAEGRIVTRRGDNVRIVCWDYRSMSGNYPILALVNEGSQEEAIKYSEDGRYNVHGYFRESCLDLMLEIPEYMNFTFKDGDVLTCYGEYKWIFIYRESNYKTGCYATLDVADGLLELNTNNHVLEDEDIKELRCATESEKEKLIKKLKASKDSKAKEYLKRFFPNHSNSSNIGNKFEFNPFDKCW